METKGLHVSVRQSNKYVIQWLLEEQERLARDSVVPVRRWRIVLTPEDFAQYRREVQPYVVPDAGDDMASAFNGAQLFTHPSRSFVEALA